MNKSEQYRAKLRTMKHWDQFLLKESGLPGPRGNIELAQAVADEGTEPLFKRLLAYDVASAPVNSPYEFLAFCGALGLGKLIAEGQKEYMSTLRACASDSRWRTREGVAMALQRIGDQNMPFLVKEMKKWSVGNPLEQRAAVAGLCEPRLLSDPQQAEQVFDLLDTVTASVANAKNRRGDDFIALRKGLGYCWSVAVGSLPAVGKCRMERWFKSADPDVQWIMRENLSKTRLARMDKSWVAEWSAKLNRKKAKA